MEIPDVQVLEPSGSAVPEGMDPHFFHRLEQQRAEALKADPTGLGQFGGDETGAAVHAGTQAPGDGGLRELLPQSTVITLTDGSRIVLQRVVTGDLIVMAGLMADLGLNIAMIDWSQQDSKAVATAVLFQRLDVVVKMVAYLVAQTPGWEKLTESDVRAWPPMDTLRVAKGLYEVNVDFFRQAGEVLGFLGK